MAPRISSAPVAVRTSSLSAARSSRWRPVSVSLARRPVDGALEADGAAARAGAGAEVDDVVGDGDRLGLVLDDEHRVALVPQLQQQLVHALDVVGVQADGGLVEHVGDVGERRPEVADHLRALGLAARQRAGGPVERRGSRGRCRRRSRACRPGRRAAAPPTARRGRAPSSARSLICIAQASAMLTPGDLRRAGVLGQPGAAAVGAGGEGDDPLDEGPDVGLHGVDVLGQERLLDRGDQPGVGEVDALDLDLGRLLVEEVVELLLGELLDRLVAGRSTRSRGRCGRTSPPCCSRGSVSAPSLSDLVSS